MPSICIDRSNLDERSRQVQYMKLVYKHAARVIAWLGPKTPGVEEAFEAAQRLAASRKLIDQPWSLTGCTRYEPLDDEFVMDFLGNTMAGLPQTSVQHLSNLFEREYFCRSW